MRIAMLGWEYPPHISGGLGTACEGLTKALARVQDSSHLTIDFIVPHLHGGEESSHMNLFTPRVVRGQVELNTISATHSAVADNPKEQAPVSTKNVTIPSLLSPYLNATSYSKARLLSLEQMREYILTFENTHIDNQYGSDLFDEVEKYALKVLAALANRPFDIIHAHDWMTFIAGVGLKDLTKRPLVVHVHSLEFDRSGEHGNPRILEIERYGLTNSDKIIAVSHYTREMIIREYGIAPEKISVVHNGLYPRNVSEHYRKESVSHAYPPDAKIVLFLGRITFQKGPDYFVEAAAKVIPHIPNAHFVMAGSGDMLPRMIERAKELGIEDRIHFPGWAREVEAMFSIADLYVMPSVSEPFGISALEAISFDTPVIISKQSGVSEVLSHALKSDFWDVNRFADLIINSLLYPALGEDMSSMAKEELKRLRWDAAAKKVVEVYNEVVR